MPFPFGTLRALQGKARAVSKGYIVDPFISVALRGIPLDDDQGDTSPGNNRPACCGCDRGRGREVSNRGHATRMRVVEEVACAFIRSSKGRHIVVNLGCGMDTTFFRLKQRGEIKAGTQWVDLDLPDIIRWKAVVCKRGGVRECSDGLLLEECDISDPVSLSTTLRKYDTMYVEGSEEEECPVLCIAEFVLNYLSEATIRDVLTTLVRQYGQRLSMLILDQTHGEDRYSQVMQASLCAAEGITLPGLSAAKTPAEQKARLEDSGLGWAEAYSLLGCYRTLFSEEERLQHRAADPLEEEDVLEVELEHVCVLVGSSSCASCGLGGLSLSFLHPVFQDICADGAWLAGWRM